MKRILVMMIAFSFVFVSFAGTNTAKKSKSNYEYYVGLVKEIDLENKGFVIVVKKSEEEKSFTATEKILKTLKENQIVKVKVKKGSTEALTVKTYKKKRKKK